jgi:hypothetical protein
MQSDAEFRLAYTQFLELARRMEAGGHYAVAYHALMAASTAPRTPVTPPG